MREKYEKSFEYIIKISETEFYDKLKKHTAFNCSSSSYDNGYEFYCDNPKNITDLKVTSTSLLSREGILAPLIKIQTKQLDENLKVNLTLQSNKIYYFLAVLFSLAGVLFGLITYFSLAKFVPCNDHFNCIYFDYKFSFLYSYQR